jgi:DNA-binding beta-propeller fold protein YncE
LRRGSLVIVLGVVAVMAVAAAVLAAVAADDGRIGPDLRLLNNGRRLSPYGSLTRVGQFPTGAALTPNGRWYWTVSTGRGQNDIRIVSVRTGRVVQTIVLPGASGGIAMDPAGARVYVSGVAESSHADQRVGADVPGRAGNVIHVFSYRPGTGSASREGTIPVPPPSGAPAVQSFPPAPTTHDSWPDRLAVSPDGKRLLVPLNLADSAAIVDVASKSVRYVSTGNYPYGAAILRDGRTGLVSNETPGTVSVIDLNSAKKVKDITVGPHLSHPEAIAVDPHADRAYVAVANSDQVAVIDTKRLVVDRTISVGRPEGIGTSPVALTVTPDGSRLLVAEAGADAIAVVALPGDREDRAAAAARARAEAVLARAGSRATVHRTSPAWSVVGHIPTAQYPTDVQVSGLRDNPCGTRALPARRRGRTAKRCTKLLYLSAKGLGTGPNPNGPRPDRPNDSDDRINETQYLPLLNVGDAAVADWPSDAELARLSTVAGAQLRPVNAQEPPAGTPLRPGGPIKHVFYVVKENRTYDQILGDEPRGDGDPKLAIFGAGVTPNAHALVRRFPLLDHVYANSEASIDGHFWTSAAKVSDYVNKAWFQNYAGRDRPYDFGVYAVTWPANGFLFDQAERQKIPYFNYGEAIAGTLPLPDKDRNAGETAQVAAKFGKSDLGPPTLGIPAGAGQQCYPNDSSIGHDSIAGAAAGDSVEVWDTLPPAGAKPGAESRFACFQSHFAQQLATNSVPAFNYLVATNDHTEVLSAGARTPRAMIADNDEFVGRLVELISHSPIWSQSAIFVIEDDSQDGADHVDAHRVPAFVISPYARQGAVVHTRYDMLSAIRSMELILGMQPLGLFDRLATPMYDAFQGTPANAAPFDHVPATVPLLERNPSGTAGARASARLPRCLDCIPQRTMDRLLWKSVHGWDAAAPPPGPNAVRERAGD